jgi:8-oxo-dGTP pyrophosphatase MutT (NUDIX family)
MVQARIRPIALGLITHQGHVFVSQGQDRINQSQFYRFLGGGIEFGEASYDALQREFQEEIQAELTNITYLACLENRFICHGQPGHELIQLFRCDFVDPKFYELNTTFTLIEGQEQSPALWIPIEQVHQGKLNLVPPGCHPYLST